MVHSSRSNVAGLQELEHLLSVGPVVVDGHPLLPLALAPDVEVMGDPEALAREMDTPTIHRVRRVLIARTSPSRTRRFRSMELPGVPSAAAIDKWIAHRLEYARQVVGTQAAHAARLADHLLDHRPEAVILLLVDGLGFMECCDWAERPIPMFVDGPSTTDFGFGQVLQASGLLPRLLESHAYRVSGYCYWARDRNRLTERLFCSAAVERTRDFGEALSALRDADLVGTAAVVLREGMDELAHRRRELTPRERAATVAGIRDSFCELRALLRERRIRGVVCLVSDHGVAWRDETEFSVVLGSSESHHARYTFFPVASDQAVAYHSRETICYLLLPGLLCRQPRANEAGFHGGLSAAESFVPLMVQEVFEKWSC